MIKLILLLALASWACRQWTGAWPWVHWQRMTGPTPVDRARRLLGVRDGPRGAKSSRRIKADNTGSP
jgi:hypothetical protein